MALFCTWQATICVRWAANSGEMLYWWRIGVLYASSIIGVNDFGGLTDGIVASKAAQIIIGEKTKKRYSLAVAS
jgi:hypothetical protein